MEEHNFFEIFKKDLSSIFHSLPDLYLILNTNCEILEASDAYLKATMIKREDVLGKAIFDVFPSNPADPESGMDCKVRLSIARILETKVSDNLGIYKHDIRNPKSEGQQFEEHYWSVLNVPVLGKNNEVKFIIHRIEDVTGLVQFTQGETEKFKVIQALETRAGQMEIEIYQRSQEIQETNIQLRDSYDKLTNKNKELEYLYNKLEKLDQLKTQFLANVSNELRTPLTLIMGPLEKLMSDNNLENYHYDLIMIERNVHTLLKLVNNLLDVTKLDSGKVEMNYTIVDLAKIIRQTASLFEPYAEEHRFKFLIETPLSIPAEIDADKVQRILINLLSNAFKFTGSDGIVRCTLSYEDNKAKIIIADSGPGIPPKFRNAVFDRFFQIEKDSARRFGGFGVGLALVKDFVQLHHGSISIEDAEEGGAAFILQLPLKLSSQKSPYLQLPDSPILSKDIASQIIAELRTQERGLRRSEDSTDLKQRPLVLIIEDNVDMNQYICEVLLPFYRTASAFDGQEGFQKIIDLHPDLIISDIVMPQMDGVELLQQIRQRSDLLEIPIIILTVKTDEELHTKILNLGISDYLAKPFSPTELKMRVANLINLKKAKEELKQITTQLVQQEKIAALWNLTAGIAHEIKNPLNFVINCTELSLDALPEIITFIQKSCKESFQEEKEEILERLNTLQTNLIVVLRHGRRADLVIQKMTEHALAKTEMSTPNNFNQFIEESVIVSEQRAREEFYGLKVEIHKIYDPSLPFIAIDSTAMLKVIYTLLNNAYYSLWHKRQILGPTFIPMITITVKNLGKECELRIRDNGLGIPDHLKSRVFTPFFTTKSAGEGVGLGLSLSYNTIVQEHNGTITFNSVEGEGTEFIITLPI